MVEYTKENNKDTSLSPITFGNTVPFGDPYWYQGYHSPYYTKSHKLWRKKIRDLVEREIIPHVHEWEESYKIPNEIFRSLGKNGFLEGAVGNYLPTKSKKLPENYDYFHNLIAIDELTRCGAGGVPWGLVGGLVIGLPPVINFGTEFLKNKVINDCISGKKVICLCISEPEAASDVAGIKTEAKSDGDFYIVNGMKKWITNGTYADYFTVACRTGNKTSRGGGISLLLLERSMPGITSRHIKCQGVWSSGTAFIEFSNVRVPKTHLIGKENDGFKQIMYNFNFERWVLTIQAIRLSRLCYEESFSYALKRETFGKKLIEHQAIRMKLADMSRQIESVHSWAESVTFQFTKMSNFEKTVKLGELCALLKVQSTKVLELCAREAVHTFGGSGYVRGGIGEKVERIYRDVRAFSIPGGAEEVLSDFAVRTMAKKYSKRTMLAKL